MANPFTTARRAIAAFISQTRAMAAVEFALITPFMLLLFLGATDVSQGIAVDRKLAHTTSTISDLVSQVRVEISRAELDTFIEAGRVLMRPFDPATTAIRVTKFEIRADGTINHGETQSVPYNGAPTLASGETIDLPGDLLVLARGQYIIVTEGWYQYPPLFNVVFDASVPLYKRHFSLPRAFAESFDIANAPPLGPSGECAGQSGGQGQGNNCNNPNQSHSTGNAGGNSGKNGA